MDARIMDDDEVHLLMKKRNAPRWNEIDDEGEEIIQGKWEFTDNFFISCSCERQQQKLWKIVRWGFHTEATLALMWSDCRLQAPILILMSF